MSYDLEAIRKKLQETNGRKVDPDEFKPNKVQKPTDNFKYRFFVLPPFQVGDQLNGGTAKSSMDLFYIRHGSHWVDNRPNPCPRLWDNSPCALCEFGFGLLKANKGDKDKITQINREWMPAQNALVNIFFTNWKDNPEELRNKVKWYNAPKTVLDIWTKCLNNDNPGDQEEPQAHGIFFDEMNAWLFELDITYQGRQNSYKTSRFLAFGGKPVPMIRKANGDTHVEAIQALLKARHNLFNKIELPNQDKITNLANKLIKGDDSSSKSTMSFQDEGENDGTSFGEESKAAEPKASEPKAAEPKTQAPAKQPEKTKPVDIAESKAKASGDVKEKSTVDSEIDALTQDLFNFQ